MTSTNFFCNIIISRFWSTSTKKKSTSSCPEFGEVISRIAEFSTSLELVSQHEHCKETYKVYTSQSKSFCKAEKVQLRPACGTTVSINNYKPMRKCPNQQLMKERVEKLVTSLSLIHYNVTFSVRDDSGEEAIPFQTKRHRHTIEAAKHLFQLSKEQKLKSFHHSSQHFKIKGLIGTSGSEKHQYIYVNNRMVEQSAVSQLISSKFPWVNKDCARYAAILFNVKVILIFITLTTILISLCSFILVLRVRVCTNVRLEDKRCGVWPPRRIAHPAP